MTTRIKYKKIIELEVRAIEVAHLATSQSVVVAFECYLDGELLDDIAPLTIIQRDTRQSVEVLSMLVDNHLTDEIERNYRCDLVSEGEMTELVHAIAKAIKDAMGTYALQSTDAHKTMLTYLVEEGNADDMFILTKLSYENGRKG